MPRGIHLINWEKVTSSKDEGGLEIKGAHEMNLALMAKLGWRLLKEKGSLWAKVLTSKYTKGEINPAKLIKRQHASNA